MSSRHEFERVLGVDALGMVRRCTQCGVTTYMRLRLSFTQAPPK